MMTIADILHPRHIDLDLKPTMQQEAVFQVAAMLKDDERVLDWNVFYGGLTTKNPCIAAGNDVEICIPHSRTSAVASMVMSVGRSVGGVQFAGPKANIHYIFVIGVPAALAADYLRIIGALARIFRNPEAEKSIRAAKTAADFLAIVTQTEVKL
jgi:mannitol/fructose-specific phosphotransferase system IIA component (Ntr-type)